MKKGQRQSGQESMRKSEGREYCTEQAEKVDMENRSWAKEKSQIEGFLSVPLFMINEPRIKER